MIFFRAIELIFNNYFLGVACIYLAEGIVENTLKLI